MERMFDRATGQMKNPASVRRLLGLLAEGRREEREIERRLDKLVDELIRSSD
jgi:hypothetical protein